MKTNKTQTEQLTQDAVMQSVLIKGLRINNYYELKGSVLGGGICQLKNLKDFIHIGDLIESDLVKPIPLTEEWILKFGFYKGNISYNNAYSIELQKTDFYLRPCAFGGFYWGFNKDKNNLDCELNDVLPLKYVHELQNLYFALTQRELTVA
jgi:hypothetical protein